MPYAILFILLLYCTPLHGHGLIFLLGSRTMASSRDRRTTATCKRHTRTKIASAYQQRRYEHVKPVRIAVSIARGEKAHVTIVNGSTISPTESTVLTTARKMLCDMT